MDLRYYAWKMGTKKEYKAEPEKPMTHVDWLKETERYVALQLGAAIADKDQYEIAILEKMLSLTKDALKEEGL